MSKQDGIKHDLFGNFLGPSFNHENGLFGSGNSNVHFADRSLLKGRVDDEFSIHAANTDTGNRTFKRNIRNGKSAGSTDHSRNIRCIIGIDGHSRCNNLHVIMIAIRKHGTDWSVNETARQDSRFRRTALSSQEAARNLPDSVHLLFKINRQGKEINPFPRCIRTGDSNHNGCFPIADENRPIGLLGNLACFDGKGSAPSSVLNVCILCILLIDSLSITHRLYYKLKNFV